MSVRVLKHTLSLCICPRSEDAEGETGDAFCFFIQMPLGFAALKGADWVENHLPACHMTSESRFLLYKQKA